MDPAAFRELGIAPGVSEAEVKAAYRKQVLQWHPDRHLSASAAEQAAAAQRFKVVTEAYDYLTDPAARARSSYGASSSSSSSGGARASTNYHNVNTDWAHSHHQHGGGGYTSRLSRWEWWRRAAKHGARSFSHTLHVGLALVLVGGTLAFEVSHTALWQARNRGKTFEDMQAAVEAKRQRQQQQQQQQQQQPGRERPEPGWRLRSSWADSMRGRALTAEEAASLDDDGGGGAGAGGDRGAPVVGSRSSSASPAAAAAADGRGGPQRGQQQR